MAEAILIGLMVYINILLWRNWFVFRYRMRLSETLYDLNIKLIESGKYNMAKGTHQWVELARPSYTAMVLLFWRRLHTFYDPDFIEELGVK